MLDALDGAIEPPPVDGTGAAKLWVVSRTLRLRRDWPDLFSMYDDVPVEGIAADHAVAFDRGEVTTVATRLPVRLARDGGWRDTSIKIGGRATDIVSGVTHSGTVLLADLLHSYPVALLVR
jgi:(1->4)-alpha-D-glucan 1-alpha-D-glucosylmutase